MPVHRDREKKENTAEEMDVEEQEHEASSSEEEDSDTSSVSEDGDSSGEKQGNTHTISVNMKYCRFVLHFSYHFIIHLQTLRFGCI